MKDMLEEEKLELCAVLRQKNKYRGNNGDYVAGGGNGANNSHGNSNNTAAKSLLRGKEGMGIAGIGIRWRDLIANCATLARRRTPHIKSLSRIFVSSSWDTRLAHTNIKINHPGGCGARVASGLTLVEMTVEHLIVGWEIHARGRPVSH